MVLWYLDTPDGLKPGLEERAVFCSGILHQILLHRGVSELPVCLDKFELWLSPTNDASFLLRSDRPTGGHISPGDDSVIFQGREAFSFPSVRHTDRHTDRRTAWRPRLTKLGKKSWPVRFVLSAQMTLSPLNLSPAECRKLRLPAPVFNIVSDRRGMPLTDRPPSGRTRSWEENS